MIVNHHSKGQILQPIPPDTTQLIGRARYLMRIAQIGVTAETHAKAEESVSKIFGSTSQASILKTRTTYKTNSQGQPFYFNIEQADKLFVELKRIVRRIPTARGTPRRNPLRDIFGGMQKLAFIYLRKLMSQRNITICNILQEQEPDITGETGDNLLRSIAKYLCETNVSSEALLLMSIPRIYMVLSATKTSQEFITKQPIKSGYYRLTVEIRLRSSRLKRRLDARLAALGVASLVLAPQILGLGKAASRGLGRFALEKYEVGGALDCLGDYVDTILGIVDNLRVSQVEGPEKLRDALSAYISLVQGNGGRIDPSRLKAPSLPGSRLMWGREPVHPCPYAPSEVARREYRGYNECLRNTWECDSIGDERLRILCILSAIGVATLKTTWKIHSRDDVKRPGVRYHTWPLGLPRGVINRDRGSGKISTITGYHRINVIPKNLANEFTDDDLSLEELDDLLDESTRHQSPFIMQPLADGSLVVIALESSGSLAEVLEVKEKGSRNVYRLYHIGKHRGRYHYIRVGYAAGNKGQQSQYFRDPLGIVYPTNKNESSTSQVKGEYGVAKEVYDAAVEWIKELLDIKSECVL